MAVRWGRGGGRARLGLRPSAAPSRLAVISLVLLLLFAPHSAASKSAVSKTRVKVLQMRALDLTSPKAMVTAFYSGVNASLWAHNHADEEGVYVEVVRREAKMTEFSTVLEEVMQKEKSIVALLTQFGDTYLKAVLPVLSRFDLVSFAPFTGSSAVRGWNPNVYFVRANPVAELLALLRYAVTQLRVLRLGFMYLQGGFFGDNEYEQAQRVMSEMGYTFCGVFSVTLLLSGDTNPNEFGAAWERFAATRPQAVIVFGSPIPDTAKFVRNMLTDDRTAGAYLLAPSAVQSIVVEAWRAAVADGVKFVPGQVVTTGTNPLAKDMQYLAIWRFQRVMQDYLANSGQKDYNDTDHFLKHDTEGELMVDGWITGELLVQALSNRKWVSDRKSFMASLLNQRRYVVDDLVFGDYGGECKGAAASQGAICNCNEGGHTVYMKQFVKDYRAEAVKEGFMTFQLSDCQHQEEHLPPVLSAVEFVMTDSAVAQTALAELEAGYLLEYTNRKTSWREGVVNLSPVISTLGNARNALLSEMQSRRVHGVAGVVTEAVLDVETVAFFDPLQLEPRLNRFRRHVIHLSPTLEQQFFVLAKYLGNTSVRSAHAVIRGEEAAAVADVLRRSLVTFGGSLRSPTLLAGGAALAGHLPAKGVVFVAGLASGDVAAIAKHVASHSGVRVFVAFSEFALLYAEFVAAFAGGTGADRVVFAMSLPHWNDTNSTSETTQKFISILTNATQRTPLSLAGFAAVRLLQTVLSRMHKVTAGLMVDFFYRNTAVTVNDMLYGSFANGTACDADDGVGCGKNYGATLISVWSLARALDPAVPVLFPAVTPLIRYTEPAAHGLKLQQLIGIIVGVAILVTIIVVVVAVVVHLRRDSRNNANAPKEPTDPVTLVFTD
ncbi:esag4, partial [Trypanosoma rangeli]